MSGGNYSANKNIRFKSSLLRSDLCQYYNKYIVVKGRITAVGTVDVNKWNENVTFKNNAPFIPCISKINNTFIDNAEDLDVVMPIYNSLEYSDN